MLQKVSHISNIDGLGTKWNFEFFENVEDSEILESRIREFINAYENKYSRFKDKSLIGILNREHVINNPDSETLEIFEKGVSLFDQTKGVFNILIGGVLEDFGYDSKYTFKVKLSEPKTDNLNDYLSISDRAIKLKDGPHVDLGGFGKGFLIDQLSALFHEDFGLKYFLINGGGDIFVTSDNNNPVKIALENPDNNKEYIFEIELMNQSLAASSSAKRRWKDTNSNILKSHLIDPANTNRFIDESTFIVADTAVDADAFATALAISPELRQGLPTGIHYLLQTNGKWIHSKGFPELV